MNLLRKFVLLIFTLLVGTNAWAQSNPVSWSSSSEMISDTRFKITFKATISGKWHMYDLGPYVGGPNATEFTLETTAGASAEGKIVQKTKPIVEKNSPIFGMDVRYFDKMAEFEQIIVLAPGVTEATVKATVEWMVCDDMSCLPPDDHQFEISISSPCNKNIDMSQSGLASGSANNVAPQSGGASGGASAGAPSSESASTEESAADTSIDSVAVRAEAMSENGADGTNSKSLWSIVIEAILWGFVALLTPCVFPMIPMTISFFMKSSQDNPLRARAMAAIFGISIVALYTLPIFVIIAITRSFGGDSITADIFNWVATHWIPNVLFFVIFMLFAASFFGLFEITMPSKLVNRSDKGADKGGLIGTFFLALTLVLVSFSCTGPIVGTVIIKSTSGEVWAPVVTMFAFSVAFALPFTLFAFFPSLLTKLPKSGGWLNSVKVTLGFLELALGLKFLSVADQVYHWGILDREIYLALWIVIFTLMGLYLLGKLRFRNDSAVETIGVTRLGLSIATFAFVVYMLPGMFGAPLRGLSGYLPPLHTQDFVIREAGMDFGFGAGDNGQKVSTLKRPKYSEFLSLPHNLSGYFDYNEAISESAMVVKPIFIDFTGHGCVNCREMEQRVWSDARVLELLREKFVILALYADDKKVLPQSDWVTTETGKVLKGLGKINSYFANKRYGINYQPYYLIVGDDGEPLVTGRGYGLNVDEFVAFLESGISSYKAQ